MKNNSRKVLVILIIILLVGFTGLASALYFSVDTKEVIGEMGKIDTDLNQDNTKSVFQSDTSGLLTKEFEFTNNSTIDLFVRIGYTVIHKDDNDMDILIDSTRNELKNTEIFINDSKVLTGLISVKDKSSYDKKFIIPYEDANDNVYYRRIEPGENIKGKIEVEIFGEGATYSDLVVTSEAIQATKKALEDATVYGWELNMFN